jgi:hypothetical protein
VTCNQYLNSRPCEIIQVRQCLSLVANTHPLAFEPALKYPAVESKKLPAFTYESKAVNPDAIQHIFKGILNITIPNITVVDLFAISPELQK